MFKYLLLSVNLLIGGILLFTSDVWLSVDAPEQVAAGQQFTITVTIHKGGLDNFARYQQELPVGVSATELESAGGLFSFKDQKIKIMWMLGTLPDEEEYKITYAINTEKNFSGTLEIGGQYNFILDNERMNEEADPKVINITGSGQAGTGDPLRVDSTQVPESFEPIITRKVVYVDGEIIVELNINKGNLSSFAKVVEEVPADYNASVIDSKDGIFTFADGTVKFLWQNLPAEEEFTVKYKLTPLSSDVNLYDLAIKGSISYLQGEKNVTVDLKENDTDKSEYKMMLAAAGVEEKKDVAQQGGDDPKTPTTHKDPNVNYQHSHTNRYDIPDPEPGIRYKVQICALQQYKSPGRVKRIRKIQLNDKIYVESHNGWSKYTVGSFPIYKQARDFRVSIWDKTDASDAFVAAYNNGGRITIQEALMISQNQWFQ